jgi:hypothetical protein
MGVSGGHVQGARMIQTHPFLMTVVVNDPLNTYILVDRPIVVLIVQTDPQRSETCFCSLNQAGCATLYFNE